MKLIAVILGEAPAALAHRYVLSIEGIAPVVLAVKNRVGYGGALKPRPEDALLRRSWPSLIA